MNFHDFTQFYSKLRLAHQHLESRKQQGLSLEHATNASGIELVQCAEAHCRAFLVRSAHEMTKGVNKTLSKELTAVLHQLIELYAYDTCMKSLGDLLRVSTTIYCNQFIRKLISFLISSHATVHITCRAKCARIAGKIGIVFDENSAECCWHRGRVRYTRYDSELSTGCLRRKCIRATFC